MDLPPLNRDLLEEIRAAARKMSRQDQSKTYVQWLDHLAHEYGFTYASLKKRIEELEAAAFAKALAESLAIEDRMWEERLAKSRVWGMPPHLSWELPDTEADIVPWPLDFIDSVLFHVSNPSPRRTLSGPVLRFDDREMLFVGEELRTSIDAFFLKELLMLSRGTPCGSVIEGSMSDMTKLLTNRHPDFEFGAPKTPSEIERVLWRLSNCRLTFKDVDFDGPILAYADTRQTPDHFQFAFHPDFVNFYSPSRVMLHRAWGGD